MLKYYYLMLQEKTVKYENGKTVPVQGAINLTPAMKDVGLAGNLEAKALSLGMQADGHASRAFAGNFYIVKRDKNGEPLDAEEAKKDEFNVIVNNVLSELIDAKAYAEKDNGN